MIEDIKNGEKISRSKAVRSFCLSCVGFQQAEVDNCCGTDCVLFPFRSGSNKSGKRIIEDLKSKIPISYKINKIFTKITRPRGVSRKFKRF